MNDVERKTLLSEWRQPRSEWSPRMKVISLVVAIALAITGVTVLSAVLDKADAGEKSDIVGHRPVAQRCVAPNGREVSCHAYAKKKVRQFKAGKLGNSKNVQKHFMSRKRWAKLVNRAKRRYLAHHRIAARGLGDWCDVCDFFISANKCMASSLSPGSCEDAEDDAADINRTAKAIDKFVIRCGGNAIIGAGAGLLTKNAQTAIFIGAAGCAWSESAQNIGAASEPCRHRVGEVARCRRAVE